MHLSVKRTRPGALACSRSWRGSFELTRLRMPQVVRTSSSAARKPSRAMVEAPKSTDRSKTPPKSRELKTNPEAEHLLSQASVSKPFQGLQFSPELVAIALVYFVQGILGLSRLAITFLYKDEFQLSPATVGLLSGFATVPWLIKPLYGFLSDTCPIAGYRRRSYLVICGAVGALSWAALATVVRGPTAAVVAVVLGSLTTACSDVVVDSIVVERARGGPQELAGSLQSLCWASAAVGGVASAYFSGSLVEAWGPRGVFAATAIFPLVASLAALLVVEERLDVGLKDRPDGGVSIRTRFVEQSQALWKAVNQRSILLPALFVFLWQATPTSDTAMFYFQTNKLGFGAEFLGRVRLVAALASLAGVGLFNFSLKSVPFRKIFLWTSVSGTVLGLSQLLLITGVNRQLGLSDELFALGDSLVLTVLGQVSFMPILCLAAQLCPEGVEATLFATLMSILNAGSFTGNTLGAILTGLFGVTATNFDSLAPLVTLCTLSSLAPLPLLRLVPNSNPQDEYQDRDRTKDDS